MSEGLPPLPRACPTFPGAPTSRSLAAMPPASTCLDPAVHRSIVQAAIDAWPLETAGVLGGHRDHDAILVDRFLPTANAAGSADGFAVTPTDFASAEAALRATGRVWLGFVHSHPDGAAAPSDRDRRELWRQCLHLVVGVDGRGCARVCAFWLDGDGCPALPLRTSSGETAR